MEDFRLRLKLRSPTGTAWHSDTMFGHLCWQVAYGALDISIKEFLKPFLEGNPPFVLSDGFPADLLPRPLLPFIPAVANTPEEYGKLKRWKKARYFSIDDFLLIREGKQPKGEPHHDPWIPILTPHASLDRNTLSTGEKGEGGFYETESMALDHQPPEIDFYVRCQPGWDNKVKELFAATAKSGFGKDKSIGSGAFEIEGIEPFGRFAKLPQANGFISLSSMVPAENDPIDARYRLRTKYGKLGEGSQENPFKRPLLQMEPGAAFKVAGQLKEFYGRVVTDIAPGKAEAIQNCYSLVVPCVSN
jgi:CRISPR-associated protein Csm4